MDVDRSSFQSAVVNEVDTLSKVDRPDGRRQQLTHTHTNTNVTIATALLTQQHSQVRRAVVCHLDALVNKVL